LKFLEAVSGLTSVPEEMIRARITMFPVILGLVFMTGVSADFLWTEANCPASVGNVTDSICCGAETFCEPLTTESACVSGDAAIYCQWNATETVKCAPSVDRQSNVCCQGQETNTCSSLFAGLCPEEFQVKKECCQGDAVLTKYSFLKTANDDELVCCNAPCAAMERAGCPLTAKCAPSQRSYSMGHPYQALGFNHHYGGGGGYPNNHQYGQILYGTGFGHDRHYKRRHRKNRKHGSGYSDDDKDKDYDYSKEHHVDEITVDDLFLMMIDSMEKEADVKVYDSDITSDPYLGKTKSGGLFVDHNLPDPHEILEEIYGRPGYYDHYSYPFYGRFRPVPHYPMPSVYPAYGAYPTHQTYPVPEHQPYPASESHHAQPSYTASEAYPTPHQAYPVSQPYAVPHQGHVYEPQPYTQGHLLPIDYHVPYHPLEGHYEIYEPYSHHESSYGNDHRRW